VLDFSSLWWGCIPMTVSKAWFFHLTIYMLWVEAAQLAFYSGRRRLQPVLSTTGGSGSI
jgi:hypothetical protein